jgi:hypothetical protein
MSLSKGLSNHLLIFLFDQNGRFFGQRLGCLSSAACKAKGGHLKPSFSYNMLPGKGLKDP